MPSIEYIDSDRSGNLFTAETFLQELSPSKSRWWEEGDIASEWIFRGHGDESWKLTPSAWRQRNEGNPLFPLIDRLEELPIHGVVTHEMIRNGVTSIDRNHPIYSWINAELEALYQFSHLGNRLGLNVEPIELSPLNTRRRHTGGLIFGDEQKNLAIAQHHGIPTRYLDFTFDSVLAAYHAASYSKGIENPPPLAVWAVNKRHARSMYPVCVDRETGSSRQYQSISFKNSSCFNNPYLQAQAGLFMSFPFGEQIFYYEKVWPDVERVLRYSESDTPVLIKFILNPSHIPDLREILRRLGFSKARLMPTLDNVAESVKEHWSE